jgi:hypothetical protein
MWGNNVLPHHDSDAARPRPLRGARVLVEMDGVDLTRVAASYAVADGLINAESRASQWTRVTSTRVR